MSMSKQKYKFLALHRQWWRYLVSKNSQEGRIKKKQSLPKVLKYVMNASMSLPETFVSSFILQWLFKIVDLVPMNYLNLKNIHGQLVLFCL